MEGQGLIRLGLDVSTQLSKGFDADRGAEFSINGKLYAVITSGKVVTDTQVDLLVTEWEKRQLSNKAHTESGGSSIAPSPGAPKLVQRSLSRFSVDSGMTSQSPLPQSVSKDSRFPKAGFERLGNMYVRGDSVIVGHSNSSPAKSTDRPKSFRSTRSNSSRRSWDDASEDEVMEKMEDVYSELDEALSGLSEMEGLTDDELQKKVPALFLFFFNAACS